MILRAAGAKSLKTRTYMYSAVSPLNESDRLFRVLSWSAVTVTRLQSSN
jgi:hypothetical protein